MASTVQTPTERSTDLTTERYPVPQNAMALARRATLGTAVAIVAALLVRAVVLAVDLDLGLPTVGQSPFAVGPIVAFSLFAGVGATVVYAALIRLTERPVRNFGIAAVAVFALLLLPMATVQGVTTTGLAVLFVLHVVVAAALVAFLVGAVRL
ncbi:DUF6069 family protein [Salinirubellus salinus]|uniref:DUF6069 family protein n=1 Tax=Salinirubellus salinus TaxID=1364945 RepID=A0A9E7UAA8_9EURY|nr:DUF6069 family protein [Salinirubellus salinus]UWM53629.1 DUF6069 family protein [Salinirubellus salinus]